MAPQNPFGHQTHKADSIGAQIMLYFLIMITWLWCTVVAYSRYGNLVQRQQRDLLCAKVFVSGYSFVLGHRMDGSTYF